MFIVTGQRVTGNSYSDRTAMSFSSPVISGSCFFCTHSVFDPVDLIDPEPVIDKFIQARTGDKGLDPPYRIEEIILTPAVKLG